MVSTSERSYSNASGVMSWALCIMKKLHFSVELLDREFGCPLVHPEDLVRVHHQVLTSSRYRQVQFPEVIPQDLPQSYRKMCKQVADYDKNPNLH